MRKLLLLSLFLSFGLGALLSCGGSEAEQNTTQTASSETKPTEKDSTNTTPKSPEENEAQRLEDRKYNDIARFLAGMPSEEGSPYAEYENTPAWKNYAQGAEAQWSSINQSKLPKLYAWRDQELTAPNKAKGLLFYPFSGADFLYANSFFPEAEQVVMMALEPLGTMPKIEEIAKTSLPGYLNGLNRAQYAILNLSFFRTIAMAQDFTGKVVNKIDGNLPVLLVFMARTGHRVLYHKKVALNAEGKVVDADQVKDKDAYYGTYLAFRREDKPEEYKELYYFAVNLQNTPYTARSGLSRGGLEQRQDLRKYLESLDITTTYVKSASYLMHRETFSIIRDLILNKSKYYLQDDSGMPIRYIDQSKWDLTFYGSYVRPIPLFSVRYQADLRKVYLERNNVKPLPFGIGYQYQPGTSNLMFGQRQ